MHLRTNTHTRNEPERMATHNENNLITNIYFFSGLVCVSVRLDIFVIERFNKNVKKSSKISIFGYNVAQEWHLKLRDKKEFICEQQ